MTNLEDHQSENTLNGDEKPLKITLADDDADDQELFLRALSKTDEKAEVTVVQNGQELIDSLKDPNVDNPDILFVDINMPVKNGLEALKEIKKDDVLKEIPTVILSTSDSSNEIRTSFESGASLYVSKPTSLKTFSQILKKIFLFHWAGELLRPIWKRFFVSEKNISNNDLYNQN